MKWLWIGDSILDGCARHLIDAYEARRPTDPFAIYAYSGWSTRRWLSEGTLGQRVRELEPDIVVVCLGTNDEGEETNRARYELAVDKLKATAAVGGATVIWVTSFSGPGSDERYQIVRGLLGDQRTISGRDLMIGVETSGEIHPTAAGYEVLSGRLVESVWSKSGISGSRMSLLAPLAIGAILTGLVLWWAPWKR